MASKSPKTSLQCIVCNRYNAVQKVIEGESVSICPDCEKDRFRLPLAIMRAKENRK